MAGSRFRACIGALAVVLLAACSSTGDDAPLDPLRFLQLTGVVFITQDVVQDVVMDALFQGRVITDAAGCLRLDSPDPATVIWPKGFTIVSSGDTLHIRDASGRDIGQIGGSFRLGGGEVQTLHDGIGVSAADRQRAQTQCPGRYWIVGSVL
jgi:hypothetical protein